MTPAERHLAWFLRISAVIYWSALPFVFVPMEWMRPIAHWLELELPDANLLEYLIRCVSAVSVFLGAIGWSMSRDVQRFLPLLWLITLASLVFDVVAIGIDVAIAMPAFWTITEAVLLATWSLTLLGLVWRARSD